MKSIIRIILIIVVLIVLFVLIWPFYAYFTSTGPSVGLDFMRHKEYVEVDKTKYHEDICSELGARPELRSRFDPTGMPSFDGVCVTLTKMYYLR